jgi:hypothetical protein
MADIPESNGIIKAMLQPTPIPIAKAKKRSLDLHYEKGGFQKSYPVPTT